ncbi:MAG: hypothetical protein QOH33_2385 [Paraburkholderia sp.]|nr:hypothetical protein [Paraburkholderia sp.]
MHCGEERSEGLNACDHDSEMTAPGCERLPAFYVGRPVGVIRRRSLTRSLTACFAAENDIRSDDDQPGSGGGHRDNRLAPDWEINRVGDVASLVCSMVQAFRQIAIVASANCHVRPQHNLCESPLFRAVKHRAFRVIDVSKNCNACIGAQVQIPEFVTGGYRSYEKIFGIPARCITEKSGVGRPEDVGLAARSNNVVAAIFTISRCADSSVASPLHRNTVLMLDMSHVAPFGIDPV